MDYYSPRDYIMLFAIPVSIAVAFHFVAVQNHSIGSVIRCVLISFICALFVYGWFWEDLTLYRRVVLASGAAAVSDFMIGGLLKMLVLFKGKPLRFLIFLTSLVKRARDND